MYPFTGMCSAECSKCELEEFQESSRELEAELEKQLEAAEIKNKELVAANSRLTMDIDALRVSFDLSLFFASSRRKFVGFSLYYFYKSVSDLFVSTTFK